jgi:hypothetical protein
MQRFLDTLRIQRWDDHRYYHHSRINQTLHLISALSFLTAYLMMFKDPVMAAMIGWLVSMVTRQAGHFFFEPKGYDVANQATHEHKEEIKVGYNLRRKVVLMSLWAAIPVVLWFDPTFVGLYTEQEATAGAGYFHHVGALWLALGVGALLFRTVQLLIQQGPVTAGAWAAKILTDPFHDVKMYYKAPLYLLRGELIDPTRERASRARCGGECRDWWWAGRPTTRHAPSRQPRRPHARRWPRSRGRCSRSGR